ncbi:hypothetical protein [Nonomuraea africana]|uniref:Uncharacterized protein n=1 Tax=Nonomuraea africana TaxID=46171 RepID=A0ABR9KGP4_9ACTN|nr:hypothetical protein [Nonomuraea africana]MBE1561184.1 hypothetical protein [Nonomuraea africana]
MRHQERLWHLTRSYGMGQEFLAAWVENWGVRDTARLMGADLGSEVQLSWAELEQSSFPEDRGVLWIGQLNDRWIQVLQYQGVQAIDALAELSIGGRALGLSWHVNDPGTLLYAVNGSYVTGMDITRPKGGRGSDPHALDAYMEGLQFDWADTSWRTDPDLPAGWLEYAEWSETHVEDGEDEDYPAEWDDLIQLSLDGYSPPLAECVTSAFVLIGRITGREFGRDWMQGVHSCYLIE